MKKILTASGAIETPWHVISFATKFAKEHSAVINGFFLSRNKEKIDSQYPFPNDLSITEEYNVENIADDNNALIDDNIKIFKDECEAAGIYFSADKDVSVQQLIDKTLDADLLIADTKFPFLERILPHIHCPEFLPSEKELPQNIVLMYDGSASSKFR